MAAYHIGNLVEEQKEVCSLRIPGLGWGTRLPDYTLPLSTSVLVVTEVGAGGVHTKEIAHSLVFYTLIYVTCHLFWQHPKITKDFLKLREEMEEMVCS